MSHTSHARAGHLPTLLSALLYFDVSFMVWVLLGPLAPLIGDQLRLSPAQRGLLIGIPLLAGSIFRPVLGILGDRIGGRNAGMLGLTVTLVPLGLGWLFAHQLWQFYVVGFLLGIAGASFAVALPMASKWYPPEKQGRVMGLAGAGNSGTLLATLFAPRLAQHYGYRIVFALVTLPVLGVLLVFFLCARNAPFVATPPTRSDYARVLREGDAWWFCFFYGLTFGGFVGLTSYLSVFFSDQYDLSHVRAGDFTTIVVIAGSFLRPVGGWLADKLGGYRFLLLLLLTAAVIFAAISTLPPLAIAIALLFSVMAMLGMGNGAVFQLVPLRFSRQVGILTGIVGAAGSLGGFFIPVGLALLRQRTGSYEIGFAVYSGIFLFAGTALLALGRRWIETWPADRAGYAAIFALRRLKSAPKAAAHAEE